jgi:ribosome-associated toxin RatA of RatAB toxin-antitoxin module
MAATSLEVRIAAPIARVWDVIVDYARYPEFVPGVVACRVVAEAAGVRQVEYEADLGIRRTRYTLAHTEARPRRVAWTLVRGDLLSRSDGAWDLREDAGGTIARYTAEIQVERPPLVPRFVVDKVVEELTRVQVPAIVHAFKGRAEGTA